jgi:uncharacterized NAD(P)/FAD-binding protein YdhS
MIDMVLWLDAHGRTGPIRVLSRHGLTPRAHREHHDTPRSPTEAILAGPPTKRLAEARRLATDGDWRGVMEGLRPVTARLWSDADAETRGRWLWHLRPWWDVHRHRVPAEVAATMKRLEGAGRLVVAAGRVERIKADDAGVAVRWRPRGGSAAASIRGDWLIDCTGPGHDPAEDPLTGPLIAAGRVRLDALEIGLDVAEDGRAIGADGTADDRLFVLGPPARAAYWETTAVPDIRKRIEALTATLTELSP